jgi:hypothetical protein
LLLAHCGNGSSSSDDDSSGKSGSGGNATGGSSAKGGTGGSTGGTTGGTSGTGGTGGSTGGTGGSTGGTGGSTGGTGGSTGGMGGTSAKGGTGGSTGGTGGTGGSTGGMGGSMGGSGGAPGGMGGGGGTSGGTSGSAGMGGGAGASTCATMDQNGKANWTPGAMTSATKDYLRSCDIRLINNNWGAQTLNCSAQNSQYNVFVNTDGSFGWNFNRGDCDTQGTGQDPDFPEIEFGVHPFGKGSSLATTPDFSSTSLLPIQIKNITSASVTINNMNISLQQGGSWDITFEFWVTQQDPTSSSPGVYAELMTFWGWQNGRYPEPPNGKGPTGSGAGDQVTAGTKTYKLEVQSDTWANGQWRYFQFRSTDGPSMNFSGKVDVKPLIDYLTTKRGYSTDFWISRFEVGSEIDDLTQGKVTVDSITFEVNGQTRSAGKM